ncbi:hypothetical protein J416_11000 [Gracilibacillus halophilus YIM-C55.5]|uniref:Uncharacterized protein n=1 Tax=Gracilibacillus halophilus YIM-C55.5 TaxID=1308866 RepID=N4WT68_9BACI|nr:DUF5819 family protein [Gracilibacillus halophilus]ENH96366.1 hypothetical protein J416_11000 [Gracilibacillus halophilus YIM-C55.5]
MKQINRWLLLGLITALSVFFVIHYSLIIMSAGPINPISADFKTITSKYTSTVFSQNWHLFAPDPVNRNVRIYIQTSNNESEKRDDNWIDITKFFIDNNNTKLITPYNRTVRLIDGIFADVTGSNYTEDLVSKYIHNLEENEKEEDPIINAFTNVKENSIDIGERDLYKFASYYANSFINNHYKNDRYIRIKIIAYNTIPYSERNNDNFSKQITFSNTYKWKKLSDIASM